MPPRKNAAALAAVFPDSQTIDMNPNAMIAAEAESEDNESFDDLPVVEILRAKLGGDAFDKAEVYIYRIGENGGRLIQLHKMAASEFQPEFIQKYFGKGLYRIRVYAPNPANRGRPSVRLSEDFECDDPIGGVIKPAAVAIAETPNTALIAKLDQLLSNTQLPNVANSSAPTMLEQLQVIAGMFKVMSELTPKPLPAVAVVSPVSQLTELMQAFKLMKDTAAEMAPEAPTENTLVNTALTGLMGVLAAGRQNDPNLQISRRQDNSIAPPMVPNNALGAPEIAPNPINDDAADDMQILVNIAVKRLFSAAEKNANIDDVAATVMSTLSDGMILDFIEPDNWFDIVVGIKPEAKQYEKWFTDLRNRLLLEYPATSDDNSPINVSSAPNSATSG